MKNQEKSFFLLFVRFRIPVVLGVPNKKTENKYSIKRGLTLAEVFGNVCVSICEIIQWEMVFFQWVFGRSKMLSGILGRVG